MINSIELTVPPVVLVLVTALLMWLIAWSSPAGAIRVPGRIVLAMALAVIGAAISGLGVVAFRQASTTLNPTKPEATSSLVRSGVYKLTRNPMYLGFLAILSGWAIFLANPLTLFLLLAFVFYMNRFQIQPEEKMLTAHFGQAFLTYARRVRRWL